MAIDWQRAGRTAVRLGRRYGPTVAAEVRKRLDERSGGDRAVDAPGGPRRAANPAPPGRPATTESAPTSSRARRIEYSPDLDGAADPGEIVWTWVEFEEADGRGKDRPVLVVGRETAGLLGLMLSSKERRAAEHDWLGMGSGPWDSEGRESWVRLDRVLRVPEHGIRREGAVCPREVFDAVAERLRSEYGWT